MTNFTNKITKRKQFDKKSWDSNYFEAVKIITNSLNKPTENLGSSWKNKDSVRYTFTHLKLIVDYQNDPVGQNF